MLWLLLLVLQTLREIPPQDLEGQIAHKRRQIGPAFLQYVAWRVDAHADDEKERQGEDLLRKRAFRLPRATTPAGRVDPAHACERASSH